MRVHHVPIFLLFIFYLVEVQANPNSSDSLKYDGGFAERMFSGFRVVGKASGMAHIEEHVIHVMYMGFNFPEYYF